MKYIVFFSVILTVIIIFTGCSVEGEPVYCGMSDKIVHKYIKDMSKKYDLHCFGSGGGYLGQLNEITLAFTTVGPKTKEELRVLIVCMTEDLLGCYNASEEIRFYLKNYPFNSSNLFFTVILKDKYGESITNKGLKKDLIQTVSQLSGQVKYRISNEEKASLQTVYEESYEEALAIVKKEHPELFESVVK